MKTGNPGSLQHCKRIPVHTQHHPFLSAWIGDVAEKNAPTSAINYTKGVPPIPFDASNKENVADDTASPRPKRPPTYPIHLRVSRSPAKRR